MLSSRALYYASRLLSVAKPAPALPYNYSKLAGALAAGFGFIAYNKFANSYNREVNACYADEILEGQPKTIQVGDDPRNCIVLVKVKNQIYALSGRFPNSDVLMGNGFLDGTTLYCPINSSSFDVTTGELIGSPGLNSLKSYPCRIEQGSVIVTMNEEDYECASEGKAPLMVKPDGIDQRVFVVIGNGAAGAACVETLRRNGFKGRIIFMLGSSDAPYDRNMLNRTLSSEPDAFTMRSEQFYAEYGIELMKNSTAQKIDTNSKFVLTSNGQCIPFDKICVTSGSSVDKFETKNHSESALNVKNVFTLQNSLNYTAIRQQLHRTRRVVILKANLQGLEFAATVRRAYPNLPIIVADSDDRPLESIYGAEIAKQILATHEANGIRVITGVDSSEIMAESSAVRRVRLTKKDEFKGETTEELATDFVLLSPEKNTVAACLPPALLEANGCARVNGFMGTGNSDIFAAGDITAFPTTIIDGRQSAGQDSAAMEQGAFAAHNMLGRGQTYTRAPHFTTEQFINVDFVGFEEQHDWTWTVSDKERNPMRASKVTYFFKGDKCIGVASVNKPGAATIFKLAMERGLLPNKADLVKGETYLDILKKVQASNPSRYRGWNRT